ncbi:hypothetical protein DBR06_SOUSAS910121, partial [Sousa chinensis]
MTISSLQPEDEATYYCGIRDHSLSAPPELQGHGQVGQKPAPHSSVQP